MKFVAITSCPTGIAHSQMAAENLLTTGEKLGHEMSVEVQGAMGTQDELTNEGIADADAVIIAADTAVSQDRFENKPVVKGTVKDGVNDAEGLIERAVEAVNSGTTGQVDHQQSDESAERSEAAEPSPSAGEQKVGGDPSKGLFARLKRLF